jgi:hypothetical protein
MEKFNCNKNGDYTADHTGFRTQNPYAVSQTLYQLI